MPKDARVTTKPVRGRAARSGKKAPKATGQRTPNSGSHAKAPPLDASLKAYQASQFARGKGRL